MHILKIAIFALWAFNAVAADHGGGDLTDTNYAVASSYRGGPKACGSIPSADLGIDVLGKLSIPLELENRLGKRLDYCTSPTLGQEYDDIKANFADAKKKGGKVVTAHGVVYWPFYNNYTITKSDKGIKLVPKDDSAISGRVVKFFPFDSKQPFFEASYASLSRRENGKEIHTPVLNYFETYRFTKDSNKSVPQDYYYMIEGDHDSAKSVEWSPAVPGIVHFKENNGWEHRVTGANAKATTDFLAGTVQESTGMTLEYTMADIPAKE